MNFLSLLLASTEEVSSQASNTAKGGFDYRYILYIGIILLLVVWMFLSYRRRKKENEQLQEKVNSLAVGDRVKTIGMIVGTISEICEDGTIVLNTGTEENPGYIRIDRQGIYQFTKTNEVEPFEESSESTEAPESSGLAENAEVEVIEESTQNTEKTDDAESAETASVESSESEVSSDTEEVKKENK